MSAIWAESFQSWAKSGPDHFHRGPSLGRVILIVGQVMGRVILIVGQVVGRVILIVGMHQGLMCTISSPKFV